MICWKCERRYDDECDNLSIASTTLYDGMAFLRFQCPFCEAVQDRLQAGGIRPLNGYHPVNYTEVALP